MDTALLRSHLHGAGSYSSQHKNLQSLTIYQGSSGGPSEDNASGLLVRSTASNWSTGSLLAVDAGSHLAAITRILQQHFPLHAPQASLRDTDEVSNSRDGAEGSDSYENDATLLTEGPFAGVSFSCASARANALHIVREHVATYLITHPHLDHLAAFAINTSAFHNTSRPKKLAALPFTVNAIKQHIFNDLVWPNLTDEDNGVGFVTFQRLTEGGNLALGEGESRGYIEVCNGLSIKGFRVSHGSCASKPPVNNMAMSEPGRRASVPSLQETPFHSCSHPSPAHSHLRTPFTTDSISRRASAFAGSQPPTPSAYNQSTSQGQMVDPVSCVVDSSAFFIRAEQSGKEVLIWGDVEPDSMSVLPRNHIVWTEAASKIAKGNLSGVFIECSYDDARPDSILFGHLSPRHVVAELIELADLVLEQKSSAAVANGQSPLGQKRKRQSMYGHSLLPSLDDSPTAAGKRRGSSRLQQSQSASTVGDNTATHQRRLVEETEDNSRAMSPRHKDSAPYQLETPLLSPALPSRPSQRIDANSAAVGAGGGVTGPLRGVKIVIIHVKDNMQDGPLAEDIILAELLEHEAELQAQGKGLGCEFEISRPGESYWF